jgi:hypothetical protein
MQCYGPSCIALYTIRSFMQLDTRLFQAAAVTGFEIATEALPLSRLGDVWLLEKNTPRIVFTMNS